MNNKVGWSSSQWNFHASLRKHKSLYVFLHFTWEKKLFLLSQGALLLPARFLNVAQKSGSKMSRRLLISLVLFNYEKSSWTLQGLIKSIFINLSPCEPTIVVFRIYPLKRLQQNCFSSPFFPSPPRSCLQEINEKIFYHKSSLHIHEI